MKKSSLKNVCLAAHFIRRLLNGEPWSIPGVVTDHYWSPGFEEAYVLFREALVEY